MEATLVGLDELRRDLWERAFRLGSPGPVRGMVGAEVELLPLVRETGRICPLEADAGQGLLAFLRRLGDEDGWVEGNSRAGSPRLDTPAGGVLTLEPGGQVEYSTAPRATVRAVSAELSAMVGRLVEAGRERGLRMVTRGIDPVNPVERAPLQISSRRYRRLDRHFRRFGPPGRRMMRQTAAVHVNLDLGDAPRARWRLANALVPLLTATFANSSRYEGRETAHRSFRARQWRLLDPLRTGVRSPAADPVEDYLEFALSAPALLLGPEDAPARPFRAWLSDERITLADWREHLTTLFPDVRPRGYLEFRCIDALPPRWQVVPLVVLTGIFYDPGSFEEVRALPLPEGPEELAGAGQSGLLDPLRAERADRVFGIALEGARRLGEEYVGEEALDAARLFRERFTARGRDPGHEPDPEEGVEAA